MVATISIGCNELVSKINNIGGGGEKGVFLVPMLSKHSRAVASLSLPGGQVKNVASTFLHFPVFSLIFFSIFLIFFLILVVRVGKPWLRH